MAGEIDLQIQLTADQHSPALYAQRLRQLASFELAPDAIAEQFIPFTGVRSDPERNLRMMVIGLIPPSAEITGRDIDRSASVAALAEGYGSPLELPAEALAASPGQNMGPPVIYNYSVNQKAALFNEVLVKQGETPSARMLALLVAQSTLENNKGWPNNNPAYYGNTPVKNAANSKRPLFYNAGTNTFFWSFDTPQQGATAYISGLNSQTRAAARSGDATQFATALQKQKYYETTAGHTDEQQRDLYAAGMARNVDAFEQQIGDPSKLKAVVTPSATSLAPTSSTTFQEKGSGAANAANEELSRKSTSGLNADTGLGRQFIQAQAQMRAELQSAIVDMANTPPLRFLVNPSSLSINNEKVISDGNRSRIGPIVEQWGDGQDTLEVSGKVAAFYALDAAAVAFADGGPGITRNARIVSMAYQNFLSLYQIYRNNAGIYVSGNDVDIIRGRHTNIALLGSIYIYYDYTMYIGSFDSFTITEADSTPYSLEYSFQFTCRATFSIDPPATPVILRSP